ncbi:MAG: pantetheine-phosphate adenylyltransferase [Planctomycetaceae bacterium]|nr:pantetheine-phosphate adenylyltransferase [Planctomycetaceae bacterium]
MTAALNPRHAVYAGSFDPVTLGHVDIVRRGARIFEQVTIGIGINPEKTPLFSPEERVALMQEVFRELPNVSVASFEGLTVDFVRKCSASVMLRGIRTVTDLDAEFSMARANSTLAPQIETVFLMAGEHFSHISSTLIRQIALLGQGTAADKLRQFVPVPVIAPLLAKYHARQQQRG